MSVRLFIQDKELDLSPDTTIRLTYQINDLAELKDRQSTYSNQFKVPRTENNIAILQHSNLIQSTTRMPYRKNRARIEQNGIQVVPNGLAIIDNTGPFFNITVYSGLMDFFEEISKKSIRDLDYSSLDHNWNLGTIWGSGTNLSGYKYPIINYGDLVDNNRDVNGNNQRPAIFFFEIVNRIYSESSGFTKAGKIYTDPNYTKVLLPFAEDELTGKASNYLARGYISADTVWVDDLFHADDSNIGIDPRNLIDTQVYTIVPSRFTKIFYTPKSSGFYTFHLHFDWQDAISLPFVVYSYVHQPGNPNLVEYWQEGFGDGVSNVGTVDRTQTVYLKAGEAFAYRVRHFGSFGDFLIFAGGYFEVTNAYNIGLVMHDDVQFGPNLPDMKQSEFIKTMANQFALFFARDTFTDTIYAARLNDIYDNIGYAIDWSNKLHEDKDTQLIEYRISKYCQKNYLRYTEDNGDKFILKGTGDGFIVCDDEALSPETTLVTLPFAATHMGQFLQGLPIPHIQKLDADGKFAVNTNPRLLIDCSGDVVGPPIHFYETGGFIDSNTDIPMAYFIRSDKDFNLGYENNLIEKYYDGLSDMFTRLKKLTAEFLLNAQDVANLNLIDARTALPYWFTPIYLRQFSSFFYLNKVNNFKGEGRTKCELIRLGVGDFCVPEYGPELLSNIDFAGGDDGFYFQDANTTIDATGAQHAGGTADGSILREFTPTESPVVKWRWEIRVTGHTAGTYWAQWGIRGGGARRGPGATAIEITAGINGVQDQALVAYDAAFDGKITYFSLKAQLTCPGNVSK